MCHVVVSVNLLEATILMSEVAAFPIETELLTVEGSTVLTLVLVVQALLALAAGPGVHHH